MSFNDIFQKCEPSSESINGVRPCYTYDPFACSVTDFGLKLKSEDDLITTGKRRKNRELKQKKLLSKPVNLLSFSLFRLSPPFSISDPQIRQQE